MATARCLDSNEAFLVLRELVVLICDWRRRCVRLKKCQAKDLTLKYGMLICNGL